MNEPINSDAGKGGSGNCVAGGGSGDGSGGSSIAIPGAFSLYLFSNLL